MTDNDSSLTWAKTLVCCLVGMMMWVAIMFAAHAAFAQQRGHNQVPCWYTPNGAAITLSCANGYWHTTMPDGTVVDGNGMSDPNATLRGSSIPLDANGSININRGQVTPPTQVAPVPAPGQSGLYGLPRTEE